jgi:hypothetical protein
MCACAYCFAIEALDIQANGVPELYIGRILTLVLLLVTRDAETEPEALMSEGAGFGLLVGARALRRALKAHLQGEAYTGRMPRYKATQLRMQETLAVSYRWHDENSVHLGNDMELNITQWQATAILQASVLLGVTLVVLTVGCSLNINAGLIFEFISYILSFAYLTLSNALVLLSLHSYTHLHCVTCVVYFS